MKTICFDARINRHYYQYTRPNWKPPPWKHALCGRQMTSSGLLIQWRPFCWLVQGSSPDESKSIRSRFSDARKPFLCVKQTLILTQFEQLLVKTNSFRKEKKHSKCYKLPKYRENIWIRAGRRLEVKAQDEDTKRAPSCRLTRSEFQTSFTWIVFLQTSKIS